MCKSDDDEIPNMKSSSKFPRGAPTISTFFLFSQPREILVFEGFICFFFLLDHFRLRKRGPAKMNFPRCGPVYATMIKTLVSAEVGWGRGINRVDRGLEEGGTIPMEGG